MIRPLFDTLRFISGHPLNEGRRLAALARYVGWQFGSRMLPGPVAVPFVGETRLLIRRGMAGATGNLYAGLAEFQEMGFVLHALRPDDGFADVGSNIGAYTVLAAGACAARAVAFEPIPSAFAALVDNIRINRLEDRVRALNMGVGAKTGELAFSSDGDTVNHVLTQGERTNARAVTVPVDSLDHVLEDFSPALIKIDVEGFETEVVKGAGRVFRSPGLLAVIMELNGSGTRYGFDEAKVYDEVIAMGFNTCSYDPLTRRLERIEPDRGRACNAIFVRNEAALAERLRTAPKRTVLDRMI